MKAEWNSATTMSGAQCVTICGVFLMLMLCAGSWDSPPPVRAVVR